MRLFARADGAIAGMEDVMPGEAARWQRVMATEPAETLDFDTETNAPLVDSLLTERDRYGLRGGVLTKDGVPVTPNPPGRYLQDRQQVEQALGQLDTLLAKLDGGTDLTVAERQQAFRFLLRAVRFILRWIVRRG